MVRVCHVITSLDLGGAQSMLARIAASPEAKGIEQSVVSLKPGGGSRRRLEATGVPVRDLGMTRRWPDPRVVRRLAKVFRAEQPDIVQTWLYHADLVGTIAARWAKVPVLAWNLRCSHGHAERRLSALAAPHACARLSRKPAVIVTNSDEGRRTHAAIGYRPPRWELIPNGFDLQLLAPVADARASLLEELDLERDAVLVGMVARLHPCKNHPLALRVLHSLSREHPEIVLVLVGERLGEDDDGLRSLRAAYPGPGRIVGLGPRADVPRLMSAFDVLLSASKNHEGFPNVLGEALACATPCVATDAGDSRAIVGAAGRVVAVEDEVGLGAALREVVELSAEERLRLGTEGREHMLADYEIGGVVRRYVSLWEELAATCVV